MVPSGEERDSLCARCIGVARLRCDQSWELLGEQRYPRIVCRLDKLIEREAGSRRKHPQRRSLCAVGYLPDQNSARTLTAWGCRLLPPTTARH